MRKSRHLSRTVILGVIEKNRPEIEKFGVKRIGLFGSYLKGNDKRGSDLDVLVLFENPTFDNYMGLKSMLERLFHKKVDLVMENTLKPALRYVKKQAAYARI